MSTEFISQIAPIIQRIAKERGYHVCSPIIAQAICESNWGKSGLSQPPYFNYFGMKAGAGWKGRAVNMKTKEEYKVGILSTITAGFRAYDSMEDGVRGYFDFINTKRYQNLKTATTPQQYLEYIKADGYATSSTYVSTNMNIINKHNLTVYDNFSNVNVDIIKPTYNVGTTYTLSANIYVRTEPNGDKIALTELSKNAQKNAYEDAEGNGILKKETRVTCKGFKSVGDQIWMQIPSGWVCAFNKGKQYIV